MGGIFLTLLSIFLILESNYSETRQKTTLSVKFSLSSRKYKYKGFKSSISILKEHFENKAVNFRSQMFLSWKKKTKAYFAFTIPL